ncbi:DUF6528 family protein [Niabella soli]|nr:DUF6528 family protein [Niabella soli]
MKRILLLTALFYQGILFAQELKQIPPGSWVTCGDDKALVLDPTRSENGRPVILWSWDNKEATELPAEYRKLLHPLDDCKPVLDNRKLLLTSSGGATILVDIATKQVEFYAHTPMAHSAAVLPGGYLAVANSTHPQGNSLELYRYDQPEKVLFKDTLYSGHGAVWNNQKQQLFVLGFNELRAYKLDAADRTHPRLVKTQTWVLPDVGGHDLSLIDGNHLLVSAHNDVWIFDIAAGSYTVFKPLEKVPNVKSVNLDKKTGMLVYTKAEESWWTFHIYAKNPEKVLNLPDVRLYKVRIAPEAR